MRFLSYEDTDTRALVLIPMGIRRRLDECGVRLSLPQWRRLPMALRGALAMMSTAPDDPDTFRDALAWMVASTALPDDPAEAYTLVRRPVPTPWHDPVAPMELADALRALFVDPAVWVSLDHDLRFALLHALRGKDKHPGRLESLVRSLVPEKS